MKSNKKHSGLFSEFPPVSTKEWEEKIHADLKGADYEKKLFWKPSDSLVLKPYYRADSLAEIKYLDALPGRYPFARGKLRKNNNWCVRQDIEKKNPKEANLQALHAISKGAEAIGFNVSEVEVAADIKFLLNSIDLSKVELHFSGAECYLKFHELFYNEINRQKIDVTGINGSYNFDPLSYFLLYGKFKNSEDECFNNGFNLF